MVPERRSSETSIIAQSYHTPAIKPLHKAEVTYYFEHTSAGMLKRGACLGSEPRRFLCFFSQPQRYVDRKVL